MARLRASDKIKKWVDSKKDNKNQNSLEVLMNEYPDMKKDFEEEIGEGNVFEDDLDDIF